MLAVLEGAGIRLTIGEGAPVLLGRESAPLTFPADQPTDGALAAGPILDLNVMVRRGSVRASVERHAVSGILDLPLPNPAGRSSSSIMAGLCCAMLTPRKTSMRAIACWSRMASRPSKSRRRKPANATSSGWRGKHEHGCSEGCLRMKSDRSSREAAPKSMQNQAVSGLT